MKGPSAIFRRLTDAAASILAGVGASFRLELLALVRSWAAALLVGASLAWTFAAPFVLKGDGTDSGWFELVVRYSLGIVFALTLVTLAAAAAGTLAKERAAKRLQLTLVRPVPRFSVALGRMLAMTAVGSFVLALSGVALTGSLGSFQKETGYAETCDHVLSPVLEPSEEVVDRMFNERVEQYPDFRELVEKQGETYAREFLRTWVKNNMYQTIRAGQGTNWVFDVSSIGEGSAVAVRVRMTDVFDRLEQTEGVFRLGDRIGRISHVNKSLVRIPLERAEAGSGPENELRFDNNGSLSISLCPRRDLHLLVRADSFGWNVFRAWLQLTSILALVVSVAMLMGACLSRSVSVYVVLSLLFMSLVCPTLIDDYPDPSNLDWLDRASLRLTDFAAKVTHPLAAHTPIAHLESASCIEWAEVRGALGWNLCLFPVLSSLLAGLVMSRKQDGM